MVESPLPSTPTPPASPRSAPPRLPRAVVALGWVSLLTDAASDMIYPLVPAFLLSIGGGAAALGVLEGVAEAVSAALKLISGRVSDRAARRKPLIALGYGISALSRPLFSVATAPAHAVFIRAADRVGKGLRGPPRDAMVAAATHEAQRGHAFGFHRMMDNFGGALGPLFAFVLLRGFELPVRTLFAASIVPGLLAVLVVLLFVRPPPEVAGEAAPPAATAPLASQGAAGSRGVAEATASPWSPALLRYLATLALFSLAGSGDLFLMRRLTDLGLDIALVPVAWVSLQLGKGLLNVRGGRLSDRYGRRRVISVAWVLYAITYVGFGLAGSWPAAWVLLAVYALHYGLSEGAQRALLAEYAPPHARGRIYGVQLALEGASALIANVAFGLVYERVGAPIAFAGAGGLALCAAAALRWLVPDAPKADRREPGQAG